MEKKIPVLFLSYDGMTDSLGQSQVIPYLQGLSKHGFDITIISFEKEERFEKFKPKIESLLQPHGISWRPFSYTKKPPVLSTLNDVVRMYRAAAKLHAEKKICIVHCRSYIAALAGERLKKNFGTKFIFDMRGFWADERVEAGIWNLSSPLFKTVYNYFKKKEKDFFANADYTISLTHAGEKEIHSWKGLEKIPVAVIPCCADFEIFSPEKINLQLLGELKKKFSIAENDFVLSYLGSVSTWYRLEEMFRFFQFIQKKKENAKFLFITNDSKNVILSAAERCGVEKENVIITSAVREEVPTYLALSQLSVFFYKDGFSRSATSPTKQAEVMGMGIPHVCNTGVGDVEMIVKESGAGYAVKKFGAEEFERAFSFISAMKINAEEIRNAAIKYYSLEGGIEKYNSVYETLLKDTTP